MAAAGSTAVGAVIATDTTAVKAPARGATLANTGMNASLVPAALLLLMAGVLLLGKRRRLS